MLPVISCPNPIANLISANKHLPDIPTFKEVAASGIDLAAMNEKMLETIEELTFYLLLQQKMIGLQQQHYNEQQQQIKEQQAQINKLKKLVKKQGANAEL